MWHSSVLLVVASLSFVRGYPEGSSSIYFCADLEPQQYVDVEQLMGMWYGIEIISHQPDARHEIVYEEGCPVLYFSEDRTPTTQQPQWKDYNYQHNYGSRYGKGYDDRIYELTTSDPYGYYFHTTLTPEYEGYYDPYGNYAMRRKHVDDIKKLRLLWDDRGNTVEYTIRYNVSKAGFWISSGPQNGSSLEPKFNEFAGTIQVLKAVGNHMVLVFCHRLPDTQLYSVLLSRVQNLNGYEIHGVHNLLNRRGLSTTNIRKVCTHNAASKNLTQLYLLLLFMLTTTKILSSL